MHDFGYIAATHVTTIPNGLRIGKLVWGSYLLVLAGMHNHKRAGMHMFA